MKDTVMDSQDLAASLGAISGRIESGETILVTRDGTPAFRNVPFDPLDEIIREAHDSLRRGRKAPTLEEIRRSLEEAGVSEAITPEELDEMIHEVRSKENDLRHLGGGKGGGSRA